MDPIKSMADLWYEITLKEDDEPPTPGPGVGRARLEKFA
jgi:hypothetical protein